jgi:hypothetical protein
LTTCGIAGRTGENSEDSGVRNGDDISGKHGKIIPVQEKDIFGQVYSY